MPSFDLSDSGGIGLAVMRGVADVALLLVFGTAVFRSVVAPAALRPGLDRWVRWAGAGALLALAAWLVLVARSLADARDAAGIAGAVWMVLRDTVFGHAVLGECLILAAVLALPPAWRGVAPLLAAVGIVLHSLHGHGFGMRMPLLMVSEVAHLLAAGAWLGALPALALAIRRQPLPVVAAICHRFSPLGMICVLVLAVTAACQSFYLVGSFPGFVETAYGWTALLKILLFALLLCAAAFNRFWAMPCLAASGGRARLLLLRSIGMEIAFGLTVILAAALLASLSPGMRM